MRLGSIFAGVMVLFAMMFVFGGAPVLAQTAQAECAAMPCAKCNGMCKATCDAELKECEGKTNGRNCPRNYRSCLKACPSMLCAQCLPVQYGAGGKKFMPGKTDLCRTPGRYQ